MIEKIENRKLFESCSLSLFDATSFANDWTREFKEYHTTMPNKEFPGRWIVTNRFDPRVVAITAKREREVQS